MVLIQPLARLGITPNTLTVIGLLLSILTAGVIAQGFFFTGGVLVLLSGIFDLFDGAMARVQNSATTFGALFDSTLDRYSESIILFGLLLYAVQHPGLHDVLWPVAEGQSWLILFIYIAVVGSLMVSYTKARAEGLGLECKTGMLARPERVIILAIGLLSGIGICIWAIAILAVFSNVTAIERLASMWHVTREPVGTIGEKGMQANTVDINNDGHHLPTSVGTNDVREPAVLPLPTNVPPFNGGVPNE